MVKMMNGFHSAAATRRGSWTLAVACASLLVLLALTTAATPADDYGVVSLAAPVLLTLGLVGLGGFCVLGMTGVPGGDEGPAGREATVPDLQRNEAELAALCDQAPIIMLLLDGRQRVRRANRAAAVAFGNGRVDELIGKTVGKVLGCETAGRHADECDTDSGCSDCRFHNAIRDILCQRTTQARFSFKASLAAPQIRGGRTSDTTLQATIVRTVFNLEPMVMVYLDDVTGQQQAEARMREQAELLDIATDAITVLDLEGRVLYWNHAAEKLYGWPVEEALGRSASRVFFESVPAEFIQSLEAVLKHGEWNGELTQINRNRKPVIVQSRATLVRDAAGEPKSILFVNTDVTEKTALESKFLRAQRLETIGSLASGIAHDLNNVLAPVAMAVGLLRLRLHEDQDQMLLQMLAGSAQRGADIVRQLLTFGRGVEAVRSRLKPQSLIKEIAGIIQETFPKSINLRTALAEDASEIIGDATQIHQVLLNLCVNARDAMPEGGTLTLSARNIRLDGRVADRNPGICAGSYLAIEVADTGTGMTPEVRERIFTPFFTTKPVGKGTGLGLATVRDIARNHGGFVEVWSETGLGTRFTVYFPALEDKAVNATRATSSPLPLGHGELVLVVDDEQSVLKLAKNLLEMHGYRVLTAVDGREALATFSVHCAAIRAVIIDLMMPNLGGASTIKEMRARASSLPIIAISGASPQDGEADDYVGEGIVFLSKPFTVQRLLAALQDALSSAKTEAIHESVTYGHPTGPVDHQAEGAAIRLSPSHPAPEIQTPGQMSAPPLPRTGSGA